MKMFLHHSEAQSCIVRNLLITSPLADEPRQLLLPPGELDEMRQSGDFVFRVSAAKVPELDKKMRPRHASRADLLQSNRRAKMARL
jgi:hypothetical protein